jgi:hypothetical protein
MENLFMKRPPKRCARSELNSEEIALHSVNEGRKQQTIGEDVPEHGN